MEVWWIFKSDKKGFLMLSWCLGWEAGQTGRTGLGGCNNVQYWAGRSESTVSDLAVVYVCCLVSGLRTEAEPETDR